MILTILLKALVALIGLVMGSFATMASYRIPRHEGLAIERSHCVHCGHSLASKDLFPLFSWLIQRGKCRYCTKPISWRYPAIELTMATLFVGIFLIKGISLHALPLYILTVSLMIMAVIDLEHTIIPDGLQLFHLLFVVLLFIWGWLPSMEVIPGAVTAGIIGLLLHYGYGALVKKEVLGWGDVKFFPIAGALVGIHALLPYFFLSGILGIILGLGWRISHGKGHFPFGPALALSLWLCLVGDAATWMEQFSLWMQGVVWGNSLAH